MAMLTSEVIQETLGPDVQAGVWAGQIMPYDAVNERWESLFNTRTWWSNAHNDTTTYHERFRGYCPRCQES